MKPGSFRAQCIAIAEHSGKWTEGPATQDHFIFLSPAQQFACHGALFIGGSPFAVAVRRLSLIAQGAAGEIADPDPGRSRSSL